MGPGAACEAVGVIAATTSAVGHRALIDESEGSAHVGHGATIHICVGPGASAAVSDSRFAAGVGGPSVAPGPVPSRRRTRFSPRTAALAEQTRQILVTGPCLACHRPSGHWMRTPWPTTPSAVWERPEVWYDAARGLHVQLSA